MKAGARGITAEVYTRSLVDVSAAPVQRYLRDLGSLPDNLLSCHLAGCEVSAGLSTPPTVAPTEGSREGLHSGKDISVRTAFLELFNVGATL